jgi:hypothetical protein
MNRWKAVLALAALWTSTALAQVSLTSTLAFPSGQNVQRVYSSEGYLQYRNSVGRIPAVVTRDANLDSLQEQHWSITVNNQITGSPNYTYEVIVEGTPLDPSQTINYKDTVNIGSVGPQLVFPDRETRTTVANSPMPFSQDSLFSIWFRNAALPIGSKTEILFIKYVPMEGSSAGAIINLPLITYDTLTIAEYDTLRGLKDTLYTRPFHVTHVSPVGAFIDMVQLTSTGDTVRLAVQAKVNGSTSWYGGAGGKFRLLAVASFNDTTWAMTIPADSLLLADSIRIAQIAEVNKGRNIIKRFLIKYFKK